MKGGLPHGFVGCCLSVCHLPHVGDAEVLKGVGSIFRWRVCEKVMNYCLYRLFRIWRERKIVEIIFLQVGL
jgi:hypothetical protein